MRIDFDGTHLEFYKGEGRRTTPVGVMKLMGLPLSVLDKLASEVNLTVAALRDAGTLTATVATHDDSHREPGSAKIYYPHPNQPDKWIRQTFSRHQARIWVRDGSSQLTNRYSYSVTGENPAECFFRSGTEYEEDCYCDEQDGYDDDDYDQCSACNNHVDPDMCQSHNSYH